MDNLRLKVVEVMKGGPFDGKGRLVIEDVLEDGWSVEISTEVDGKFCDLHWDGGVLVMEIVTNDVRFDG